MNDYQKQFVDFMLDSEALKFGDFTLKSGRRSPFFMNASAYQDGYQIGELARFYAKAIHDHFGDFDVLFGPAYKGIPLAVAAAQAYYDLYGKKVRYCSDRKELKDHGEKSGFLGSRIQNGDRVLMIEDVTTSGKSISETYPKIKEAAPDAEVVGLIVSLNRAEKGTGELSALEQIEKDYGFKARAIVSMPEVVAYLDEKGDLSPERKDALKEYYVQYGSSPLEL